MNCLRWYQTVWAPYLRSIIKTERGASLVEYALLLALIAVIAIAIVTGFGQSVSEKFSVASSGLK